MWQTSFSRIYFETWFVSVTPNTYKVELGEWEVQLGLHSETPTQGNTFARKWLASGGRGWRDDPGVKSCSNVEDLSLSPSNCVAWLTTTCKSRGSDVPFLIVYQPHDHLWHFLNTRNNMYLMIFVLVACLVFLQSTSYDLKLASYLYLLSSPCRVQTLLFIFLSLRPSVNLLCILIHVYFFSK